MHLHYLRILCFKFLTVHFNLITSYYKLVYINIEAETVEPAEPPS